MSILLSNYEALRASYRNPDMADMNGKECPPRYNRIAKAQLKKVVEWVIDQNDFDEEEDNSPGAYYVISKRLWLALLKETE